MLRVNATIEEVIEAFDEYRDFTPTYEPKKINSSEYTASFDL